MALAVCYFIKVKKKFKILKNPVCMAKLKTFVKFEQTA